MLVFSSPDEIYFIENSLAMNDELRECGVSNNMSTQNIDGAGLDPDNISLLNWNIYKGQGDDWQNDLSAFAKTHELMVIQEAMLDRELSDLLEEHDFNWIINTAFHLNEIPAGVMNMATSQAVDSCGFKVKEPIIRVPKSALISYYAIQGTEQQLLVANIHGVNFTLGMGAYRNQLAKLYDVIAQHEGPMIVAGDFNSWSKSRIDEVQQMVALLSLTALEYEVNNKTHIFGNAIDHVFYRQLEMLSNEVLEVSSSDHNPISANFRYTEVF